MFFARSSQTLNETECNLIDVFEPGPSTSSAPPIGFYDLRQAKFYPYADDSSDQFVFGDVAAKRFPLSSLIRPENQSRDCGGGDAPHAFRIALSQGMSLGEVQDALWDDYLRGEQTCLGRLEDVSDNESADVWEQMPICTPRDTDHRSTIHTGLSNHTCLDRLEDVPDRESPDVWNQMPICTPQYMDHRSTIHTGLSNHPCLGRLEDVPDIESPKDWDQMPNRTEESYTSGTTVGSNSSTIVLDMERLEDFDEYYQARGDFAEATHKLGGKQLTVAGPTLVQHSGASEKSGETQERNDVARAIVLKEKLVTGPGSGELCLTIYSAGNSIAAKSNAFVGINDSINKLCDEVVKNTTDNQNQMDCTLYNMNENPQCRSNTDSNFDSGKRLEAASLSICEAVPSYEEFADSLKVRMVLDGSTSDTETCPDADIFGDNVAAKHSNSTKKLKNYQNVDRDCGSGRHSGLVKKEPTLASINFACDKSSYDGLASCDSNKSLNSESFTRPAESSPKFWKKMENSSYAEGISFTFQYGPIDEITAMEVGDESQGGQSKQSDSNVVLNFSHDTNNSLLEPFAISGFREDKLSHWNLILDESSTLPQNTTSENQLAPDNETDGIYNAFAVHPLKPLETPKEICPTYYVPLTQTRKIAENIAHAVTDSFLDTKSSMEAYFNDAADSPESSRQISYSEMSTTLAGEAISAMETNDLPDDKNKDNCGEDKIISEEVSAVIKWSDSESTCHNISNFQNPEIGNGVTLDSATNESRCIVKRKPTVPMNCPYNLRSTRTSTFINSQEKPEESSNRQLDIVVASDAPSGSKRKKLDDKESTTSAPGKKVLPSDQQPADKLSVKKFSKKVIQIQEPISDAQEASTHTDGMIQNTDDVGAEGLKLKQSKTPSTDKRQADDEGSASTKTGKKLKVTLTAETSNKNKSEKAVAAQQPSTTSGMGLRSRVSTRGATKDKKTATQLKTNCKSAVVLRPRKEKGKTGGK